jgi:hypothetical protein
MAGTRLAQRQRHDATTGKAVTRRALVSMLVIVMALVASIGMTAPAANAKAKPAWSLKFGAPISGTAKAIKVVSCREPGGQLAPVANFKVGKATYQIQIRLDPPVQAGTRPFGSTASPTTVSVNLIRQSKTPASWTTGDGNGSGTVNADLVSGTIKGQLIGLGANGIATTLTGKFACP